MPFDREFATGESLLSLDTSPAFQEIKGRLRIRPASTVAEGNPEFRLVPRRQWRLDRVIAVDGSSVPATVRNGFPAADASLVKVAVVRLDLSKLERLPADAIPSPRVFYDMERVYALDLFLPGANVDRNDVPGDSPRSFFRETVFYEAFGPSLTPDHETLLETVRAIVGGPHRPPRPPDCPIEGCDRALLPGMDQYVCSCPDAETLYETDAFRFAERFSDVSFNGEAHGQVRQVLEVVCLLNILRYFARDRATIRYLRDAVFILDGPLALFGQPAWLTPYVRKEFQRLNALCRREGFDLAVFGFEKSGAFVEHFDQLDMCPERGPRGLYPNGTAFAPDAAYINRNITLRPAEARPHGQDTYFGRKLFYKTASGGHAIITTAMVNEASQDFRRCDAACFPRLGDMLDVLDHLATYLHRDGFMPLVRAHAHAAIPFRRGADIIRSLFGELAGGAPPCAL